jgi:glycosyltransferase involved in cell wall biosynthesis
MPDHKQQGMNPDSQYLVSVIIPCYNHGDYLLESLQSLCEQTFKNFEVLVINDGSTDPKTIEILASLCTEFPSLDLRVISQENQGPPGARNRAILEALGYWVMMLDADDKVTREYLDKTLTLARNKNLDFVSTDIQNFGAQNHVSRVHINLYDELFANRLLGCSLFKKCALLAEPYDPTFCNGYEDWELWVRLLKNGYRGEVIHEPLYLYRRQAESRFTKTYMERSRHIRKIREKHAELYRPEQLARLKKENKEGHIVPVRLHELHYQLGLRFPSLASLLMRIYLTLRPYITHLSR